ncbi:MAG TPA: FAD-dependent oxidoreductase [Burkholderiaceae bacterium]|nr:FAD-dependent oxidoreductase [Burkholderiaceae bacterium]
MPSHQHDTVLVIGAGIIGLCVAHALRGAGYRVTILDDQPPGSQCSFGNAGALSSGSVAPLAMPGILKTAGSMLLNPDSPLHIPFHYWLRAAPWLSRFASSARPQRVLQIATALTELLSGSVAAHQTLAQAVGCRDVVHQTGQLHLYRDEQALAKDHASWNLKRSHGLRMEDVDFDGIHALEPSVGADYRRGVYLPDEGWLSSPDRYTRSIAAALRAMGVTFETARASKLERAGTGWQVSDGAHRWEAAHVVISAGIGSRALLAQVGPDVPLESQRGYHVQAPEPCVRLSRVVVLADKKIFMTPMEGGLRIAGTVEFARPNHPPSQRRALLLERQARAGLNGLSTSGFTTWMGHRPCLPDSLPVLGPVRGQPGLWCAFGHGHLGMTGSANTAILISRSFTGTAHPDELASFAPERFQHSGRRSV